MYLYDSSYILVLIGALLCFVASGYLKKTFKKYSQVRCQSGISGAEAAARILRSSGIVDVKVERVPGNLTDHYDPRNKTLRLSDSVYDSNSIAAVGVAAHECGHAVQHNRGYVLLKLRSLLLPIASIGSKLGFPLVFLGILFGLEFPIPGTDYILSLIDLGIIFFGAAVLFQLLTLPVEFNASGRALHVLHDYGIMGTTEVDDTRRVLTAAALTYVASAATAALQLFRLILLRDSRRR